MYHLAVFHAMLTPSNRRNNRRRYLGLKVEKLSNQNNIKMATEIKFVRQTEIHDIFSFVDENGETNYTSFPRTMEMTLDDVESYLN